MHDIERSETTAVALGAALLEQTMREAGARIFAGAMDDRDAALVVLWASITEAERSMARRLLLQSGDEGAGLEELRHRVVADWRARMRGKLRDELFHLLFGEIEAGSPGDGGEQGGYRGGVSLLQLTRRERRRFEDVFFARHDASVPESSAAVETIADAGSETPTPPPIEVLTYGLDEVAAALGYAGAASFRKARPSLEAAGFPRRIPNMGARWSRAAVDAWVAQAGTEG